MPLIHPPKALLISKLLLLALSAAEGGNRRDAALNFLGPLATLEEEDVIDGDWPAALLLLLLSPPETTLRKLFSILHVSPPLSGKDVSEDR
jgi:hypothetical protein